MKHIPWPSIGQFRSVVKNVQHRAQYVGMDDNGNAIVNRMAVMPTLEFEGTCKLHGCVHKDTLITLADGSKEKISDIEPGTSILSFNEETNEIEFDTVNEIILQNLDKCWVELRFDDGTILKCTEDHPILTDEGWVEAKNISENHVLVTENV